MTVRYKNEAEDWGIVAEWYLTSTESGKTYIREQVSQDCTVFYLACVALALAVPSNLYFLMSLAIFGSWLLKLLLPKTIRSNNRASHIAWVKDPVNSAVLQERTLQITAEDLFNSTSQMTSAIKWSAVSQITVVDQGAIFLIGTLQSIFVPRHRLAAGNFDAFVTEAKRFHAVATGL